MTYRNRAKCKNCGDVIESTHNHDFVTCTCYRESLEALHVVSDKYSVYKEHQVFDGTTIKIPDIDYKALYSDPEYKRLQENFHGFFLDGGKGHDGKGGHTRYGGNFEDMIPMNEDTVEDQVTKIY